jgi:hypothetical protein
MRRRILQLAAIAVLLIVFGSPISESTPQLKSNLIYGCLKFFKLGEQGKLDLESFNLLDHANTLEIN